MSIDVVVRSLESDVTVRLPTDGEDAGILDIRAVVSRYKKSHRERDRLIRPQRNLTGAIHFKMRRAGSSDLDRSDS